MALFDRYVAVDWSARRTPATGADSIWIAQRGIDEPVGLSNPPTRLQAEHELADLFDARAGERVLLGFDVGLGYPAGTAALLGVGGSPPWRMLWDAITDGLVDDDRNRNNRFDVAVGLNRRAGGGPGPFWGAPDDSWAPELTRTKPPATPTVGEFRQTESQFRAVGFHPKSMWQLLGAGSVGGQSLTAIPVLRRLLNGDLVGGPAVGPAVDIWPFTTGLAAPVTTAGIGSVVVAEVWPSRFLDLAPTGMVKDAAQVAAVVDACALADRSGELAGWFAPDVDGSVAIDVVDQEGWVLGPPVG